MSTSTFTQRLEQRKKESEGKARPDKIRIDRWRVALMELRSKIRKWLDDPLKKKLIELTEFEKELHEDRVGAYKVKGVIVSLGRQRIVFDPVATYVIGAFGRVDVVGPAAKFTLIRQKDDVHWSLVNPNDPRQFEPFTKETFEQTLLQALG